MSIFDDLKQGVQKFLQDEENQKWMLLLIAPIAAVFIAELLRQKQYSLYALYYRGNIVYIGITKRGENRIIEHIRNGLKFTDYKFLISSDNKDYILDEERKRIQYYRPKYNINHNY